MQKNKNDYSTFHDVENHLLAAWNRAQTAANIAEDVSEEEALAYLAQFNELDSFNVKILLANIQVNGFNKTRASVMKELEGMKIED